MESRPAPATRRLAAGLAGELSRLGVRAPSAPAAVERLLLVARTFLSTGDPVAIPGLGRLVGSADGAGSADPTAFALASISPDPPLAGRWPHSLLEPHEFFEGRWTGLLHPRSLGGPGEKIPRSLPLRHLTPPRMDDLVGAKLHASLPHWLAMTVPEDPTDSFNLDWLSETASAISTITGRAYLVGTQRYERALFFGVFEKGRELSVLREDVPKLFARTVVPTPRTPPTPRGFFGQLDHALQQSRDPYQLARRLAGGLSGGEVDLDAASSLWYAILDGHYRGEQAIATPEAFIEAVGLAWGTVAPTALVWEAVETTIGRFCREISTLPIEQACLDLPPLGVLFRIDEPEIAVPVPRLKGEVVLPARSRWVLGWGGVAEP